MDGLLGENRAGVHLRTHGKGLQCIIVLNEQYVGFYVMDDEGAGGIHNDIVRLVPTMRCKSCGHRMIAETTTEKTDSVVYLCTCGEKFDGSIIKKLKGLTWK